MKLPYADQLRVDREKITDYLLSTSHPSIAKCIGPLLLGLAGLMGWVVLQSAVRPQATKASSLELQTANLGLKGRSGIRNSLLRTPVSSQRRPDPAIQGRVIQAYSRIPLHFEANQGQADGHVNFLNRLWLLFGRLCVEAEC